MIAAIIPVIVFLLVAAILNGKLLLKKKYGYDEKAYLFIPILLTSSVGLLVAYDIPLLFPSTLTLVALVCLISIYLTFSYFWSKTLPTEQVYGLKTIPRQNQSIVRLNPLADTTKLFEIFFSRCCGINDSYRFSKQCNHN